VAELRIAEFENTVVLYFQTPEPRINAYALAATLTALADAAKAAARTLNSGVDVEIVVEALSSGSFRAKVTAVARQAGLFAKNQVVTGLIIGVLSSYIYDHTLAKRQPVEVVVQTDEVIVVSGDDRIIVPRAIHDAKQMVEKDPVFVRSIDRMLEAQSLMTESQASGSLLRSPVLSRKWFSNASFWNRAILWRPNPKPELSKRMPIYISSRQSWKEVPASGNSNGTV